MQFGPDYITHVEMKWQNLFCNWVTWILFILSFCFCFCLLAFLTGLALGFRDYRYYLLKFRQSSYNDNIISSKQRNNNVKIWIDIMVAFYFLTWSFIKYLCACTHTQLRRHQILQHPHLWNLLPKIIIIVDRC